MPHNLSLRELALYARKQFAKFHLLRVCAVVNRSSLGVNATEISNVDAVGVISAHTIRNLLDGLQLVTDTVCVNHIVRTGVLPTLAPKLSKQICNPLPLIACRAMHENDIHISHFIYLF